MNANPDIALGWGLFWLLFSLWASGFNPLAQIKWHPPRVMWLSRLLSVYDKIIASETGGKTFWEVIHERRGWMYRLLIWPFSFTETASLSTEQNIERTSWLQIAAFGLAIFVFGCVLKIL